MVTSTRSMLEKEKHLNLLSHYSFLSSAMSDATNHGTFLQASSPIDSALFFVFAAFILNVIVVIIAFCYFDPAPHEPALVYRTYHTLRRLSRRNAESRIRMSIKSEENEEESNDSPAQVLFV